jgi:hypothetical protein
MIELPGEAMLVRSLDSVFHGVIIHKQYLQEEQMKKLSLVVVLLLAVLMIGSASAQTRLGGAFAFNLANMSADPETIQIEGLGAVPVNYKSRTGIGFGGVVDLGLSENVTLHMEPMFLQKGSKIEAGGGFTGELKAKTSYIEVPVLFKFALGTSTTRPYVMAGPTLGLLLSAKIDDVDVKDDLKSIDFGLAFGGGVSIPAGNNSVFVEARYALGLSNVSDMQGVDLKNRGIQFVTGITFPVGQ